MSSLGLVLALYALEPYPTLQPHVTPGHDDYNQRHGLAMVSTNVRADELVGVNPEGQALQFSRRGGKTDPSALLS